MAFNTSLDLALAYAASLNNLGANTKPSSTDATAIWGQCYRRVQIGLVAAGLDPTTFTAASAFEEHVQGIEAQLTSGKVLLARESLGEQLRLSAVKLCEMAESQIKELKKERALWLTLGATGSLVTSGYAASHFTDDADPDFDFTVGTGDRDYAADVVIQDTETF